jgi:hypothetical protein
MIYYAYLNTILDYWQIDDCSIEKESVKFTH